MSSYPHYDKGSWEAICDSCGRKFKASQLRLRWDGLRVCSKDWEVRHPQDFVRAKVDIQAVPWTRPESSDAFIAFCTPAGSSCLTDYATADCSIADLIPSNFDPTQWFTCISLTYSTNTIINIFDFPWACDNITVSSNLTIDGSIGIS